MISVQEAKQTLEANIPVLPHRPVDLHRANGLVLAEDVVALNAVPSFDNSAMDGYAIKYSTESTRYTVSNIIQAGETERIRVPDGHAARIFTGAPIPDGCDTVVQQEVCTVEGGVLTFDASAVTLGMHVRKAGGQNAAGEVLVQRGKVMTPGIIGLLASTGHAKVPVYPPPIVRVIVTGNELIEPGAPLHFGHVYNSNQPTLIALLESVNVRDVECTHVADDPQQLFDAVNDALAHSDMLILSGGISVGDYDYVQEVLSQSLVETLFYKVRQKPGKPLFAGRKGSAVVFGLPGNPASVITALYQYVKPTILRMMGHQRTFMPDGVLRLTNEVRTKRGLTHFLKAKKGNGTVCVLDGQESFNQIAFSSADCLVVVDEETEYLPVDAFVKAYFME